MSVLTLADAKAHLGLTQAVNDVELQRHIDAAEAAIGARVGPLTPTSKTVRVPGGNALLLPPPVISVTTIVPIGPGNPGPLDVSALAIDPNAGIVYRYDSVPLTSWRWLAVTYQAGWASVPPDLLHAVREMVRHLWASQRGGGTRPGAQASPTPVPGAAFAFPWFVSELLEPYLQAGVA